MSLQLRWVDDDELDRVAETRLLCYGAATRDLDAYRERLRAEPRLQPGDCLLAERDGRPVGTCTSLSLRMWVRGGVVPCQGVAWVGTVKTHRRVGGGPGEPGVATRIMHETLRLARERGQVVSALMPFRGSFYEHFGYGIVERQTTWTVPISVLPRGPFESVRFYEPGDFQALTACRQRLAESREIRQCDIERSLATWQLYLKRWEEGFVVVDRVGGPGDAAGSVRGWMYLQHIHEPDGTDTAHVVECGYEDAAALRRQLHFLASLRDQYTRAKLTLPGDLPLNRLLSEPQITHRDTRNHPTAEARPFTRMQVRILDHKGFLEAMRLPVRTAGRVAVTVRESEGHASRLRVDISDGRAVVSDGASDSSSFECTDVTWAAIACGDLRATVAVRLGLATSDPAAAQALDVLAEGPAPFTNEYF